MFVTAAMHPIARFKTILIIFTLARCASACNECPANQEILCENLRSSSGYTYTVPPGVLCSENCEQGWYYQNGTFIVDSTPNGSGKRLPVVVDVTPQNLTISVCENLQWQLYCKCKCFINYTVTDLKHSAAGDPLSRNNTSGEEQDGNHKDLPAWGIALIGIAVVAFITILFTGIWWGLKPEYTQTHGDSCHGGDLN